MRRGMRALAGSLLLLATAACAGGPEGSRRELLGETPAEADAGPAPVALENPPETVSFRAAPRERTAYRLAVEWAGQREEAALEGGRARRPLEELHITELEYTEVPVPGRLDLYTVVLDGLHHRVSQSPPQLEREVELGSDRMRTRADGETVLELRGAQPDGDLTPRKLLNRVFGTVRLDPTGNVQAMRPQGKPVARRWLADLPLLRTMAYARPPLPPDALAAGATWTARRLPASPAGELGLLLEVRYALGGFRSLGGVPCAWVNIDAEVDGANIAGLGAMVFERVRVRMRGEAWVELESSRIRLLQLEDEVRVSFMRGQQAKSRLRHRTTVRLELRDPKVTPATWLDGSTRFGPR